MASRVPTVQYGVVAAPATVFILALVPEGGPTDTRMVLVTLAGPSGPITPVFSSIRTAADFLTRAQQLGHPVTFDYVFRLDHGRLAADFPDTKPLLDPTAEAVFGDAAAAPPA
jgi:hypothetical protein